MDTDVIGGERSKRSPSIAALLSFLWPGLGQWYRDRPRAALVFAVPAIAVAALLLIQLVSGVQTFALELLDPNVALVAFVIIVLLGIWRVIAIIDAAIARNRPGAHLGRRVGTVVVLLLVLTTIGHGLAGYYAWSFYTAGTAIFQPGSGSGLGITPAPSPSAGQSNDPPIEFNANPVATPATPSSRINVLLTGIDSSATRDHALTDTLIVVSVDPATKTASMISLPRDIARFPLWDGRTFNGKINSLLTWASQHPAEFPEGPLPSLIHEIGFLIGAPIHYYAAVDLAGFVDMVDAVGGVQIVNSTAIFDPGYGGWTNGHPIGFSLSAGSHHLDGQTALAFARSRKTTSDFDRARRQQQLLVAIERKMDDPAMIAKLPNLLTAAAKTIRTNFPSNRLGEMLGLGGEIPDDAIAKYVLGPPYSVHPPTTSTGNIYILKLDMAKVATLSRKIFGADSAYAPPPDAGGPSATPGPSGAP